MSEGRERFLRAIAERVPVARVEEVHLFPAIRQGGWETGLAVIAVAPEAETPAEGDAAAVQEVARDVAREPRGEPQPRAAAGVSSHDEPHASPPDDTWLDTDAPLAPDEHPGAAVASEAERHLAGGDAADADATPLEALLAPAADATTPAPSARAPRRLTVFSARYRLAVKGADRGKWEVDITEEADAPAATVDEVVRGVHRRAGLDAEPERLTGDAFRAAIVAEPWPATR